jgi:hypothetical protein
LNLMRYLTGRKWSLLRYGMIGSRNFFPYSPKIYRTALFYIFCNLKRFFSVKPPYTELQ